MKLIMKITKPLLFPMFSGAILLSSWMQAAQGDGTSGGEGNGTTPGPRRWNRPN